MVSSLKSDGQGRGYIREVKAEIRVLGLEAAFVRRGYTDFIGVVFRGNLWLDGVLRRRLRDGGSDATKKLAKSIRESPHFGQLRVVVIQDSPEMRRTKVQVGELHELTGLPMIMLSEDARGFRAYGLDDTTVLKILRRTRGPEALPEALRVARILARGLSAYRKTGKPDWAGARARLGPS